MIGYLDPSAFVPLLIAEPSSAACRRFWDDADDIATSRLLYVETAAALAQANRMDRIGADDHRKCLGRLDRMWRQLEVVEIDEALTDQAARLAAELSLRGYDAVHCAAAERLRDPELVAAAGDTRLLEAWAALGISTFDVNQPVDE